MYGVLPVVCGCARACLLLIDVGIQQRAGTQKWKHTSAHPPTHPTPCTHAHAGEYHLFFSNVLSNDAVRTLAQADTYELVQQVREIFADFYALAHTLTSLLYPIIRSTCEMCWASRTCASVW